MKRKKTDDEEYDYITMDGEGSVIELIPQLKEPRGEKKKESKR